MQKPPEIPAARRVSSIGASLEEDGGDDQELAGEGDDARDAGFNDTHSTSFQPGAVLLPQPRWE